MGESLDLAALAGFVEAGRRLLVLTGAGCSTESGIPDYRDEAGRWRRARRPMTYQEFVRSEAARRRYWARSRVGWRTMASARPNPAHEALAALERRGRLELVVTQNVDGLHQKAGSRRVVDLHGRLDEVECLACRRKFPREEYQRRLAEFNGAWSALGAAAPDGDAEVAESDAADFRVPPCERCGGVVKPAVVFFGENVPRETVARAMSRLAEADALLCAGTSLSVWSGYRFALEASRRGVPIAIVNRGWTRADALAAIKVESLCGQALAALLPLVN